MDNLADTRFELLEDIEDLNAAERKSLAAFIRTLPPTLDTPHRIARSQSLPLRWRLIPVNLSPEDVRRICAEMDDITVEYYADVADRTRNPTFMWLALYFALEDNAKGPEGKAPSDKVLIPRRLAVYLQDFTANLLKLCSEVVDAVEPTQGSNVGSKSQVTRIMETMPQVLGFTSQGTNAFERYYSALQLMEDFSIYSTAIHWGASAKEGYALVKEKRGLADERRAQRRVAMGRELSGGRKLAPGRSSALCRTKVT